MSRDSLVGFFVFFSASATVDGCQNGLENETQFQEENDSSVSSFPKRRHNGRQKRDFKGSAIN